MPPKEFPPSASDCSALRRILREGDTLDARALSDPAIDFYTYSNLLDALAGVELMLIAAEAGGFC